MRGKTTDWEAIERLYRTGQLSNAEIGHMHGISKQAVAQKAKRLGWLQDLSTKVAVAARAKLTMINSSVVAVVGEVVGDSSRARAEDRDIEEAAVRVVEVVRGHRKKLARLNGLSAHLMDQLDKMLFEVEQDAQEKALAEGRPRLRLDLDKASKTLATLAAVLAKTIPLERQAFNVDGARPDVSEEFELPASLKVMFYEMYGRN